MKSLINAVFVLFFLFSLSGCAPVKFYSGSGLTQNTGLKYYTVKPYIQVERELTGGNIVKATVVYLPDLVNPQYIVIKDGLGSRKVDIKLSEGAISTLGVATDPKIAESVDALAALISKSSAAIADLATLKGIPAAAAPATVTELYEVFMGPDGTTMKKIEFK